MTREKEIQLEIFEEVKKIVPSSVNEFMLYVDFDEVFQIKNYDFSYSGARWIDVCIWPGKTTNLKIHNLIVELKQIMNEKSNGNWDRCIFNFYLDKNDYEIEFR